MHVNNAVLLKALLVWVNGAYGAAILTMPLPVPCVMHVPPLVVHVMLMAF